MQINFGGEPHDHYNLCQLKQILVCCIHVHISNQDLTQADYLNFCPISIITEVVLYSRPVKSRKTWPLSVFQFFVKGLQHNSLLQHKSSFKKM